MRAAPLVVLLSGACSRQDNWVIPTPRLQRMVRQPKVDAYEPMPILPGGLAMQHPPDGTVHTTEILDETSPPWTMALLLRGQDRFDITCAVCHGVLGDGESTVGRNMELRRPPSLLDPHVRGMPDDSLYSVVREGYGLMPSYGEVLPVPDAWAVVAYVRALQRSQDVAVASLPPWAADEARRELP